MVENIFHARIDKPGSVLQLEHPSYSTSAFPVSTKVKSHCTRGKDRLQVLSSEMILACLKSASSLNGMGCMRTSPAVHGSSPV